jgi:hypothetical protein
MFCDEFVPEFSVQRIKKFVLNFKPQPVLWSVGDVSSSSSEDFASPIVQSVDVILAVEVELRAVMGIFAGSAISPMQERVSFVLAVEHVFDEHLGVIMDPFHGTFAIRIDQETMFHHVVFLALFVDLSLLFHITGALIIPGTMVRDRILIFNI